MHGDARRRPPPPAFPTVQSAVRTQPGRTGQCAHVAFHTAPPGSITPGCSRGSGLGSLPLYADPRPPLSFRALPGLHGSARQGASVPAAPPRPSSRRPLSLCCARSGGGAHDTAGTRVAEPRACPATRGSGEPSLGPFSPAHPQPTRGAAAGRSWSRARAHTRVHTATHLHTQGITCDMCPARLCLCTHHTTLAHACAPPVHGPRARTALHPARAPQAPTLSLGSRLMVLSGRRTRRTLRDLMVLMSFPLEPLEERSHTCRGRTHSCCATAPRVVSGPRAEGPGAPPDTAARPGARASSAAAGGQGERSFRATDHQPLPLLCSLHSPSPATPATSSQPGTSQEACRRCACVLGLPEGPARARTAPPVLSQRPSRLHTM